VRAERLQALWERRLVREGLADPDRYLDRAGRLQRRFYASRRGDGGRAVEDRAMPLGRLPALGRVEAGEARAALVTVDLRGVPKRHGTGRPRTVFPPGVGRRIVELHGQGVSFRQICRVLELRVSYGAVRRFVLGLMAMRHARHARRETLREMVLAAEPALVKRIRGRTRAELEGDPVVEDLLAEDRRGVWDLMVDGRPRATRRRAMLDES